MMNKFLFTSIFALGAAVVLWIGGIFLGADAIGLTVTALIGIVYLIGTYELSTFRRSTNGLASVLREPVNGSENLDSWIAKIPTNLQNPVRMRINGDRIALAAPVLTPYLLGLLVMLGLLGTFIGMVDTLKGAVTALEGTTELEAIRAGLTAPIGGLGLAFGTSVAGVSASAMLGLLSTLSRRERILASQQLDQVVAADLLHHSHTYQQQQAFRAIQEQADVMPKVAGQLSDLAEHLEKMNERIGSQLQDSQQQFNDRIIEQYQSLNQSLDLSLKSTLRDTVKDVGDKLHPLAKNTFEQLSSSAEQTQDKLQQLNQTHLKTLDSLAEKQQDKIHTAVSNNLEQQSKSLDSLLNQVGSMVTELISETQKGGIEARSKFDQMSDQWNQQQNEHAEKISQLMQQELASMRKQESQKADAAVARLDELQAVAGEHLTAMGLKLEEPMTRLIEAVSETPKAAAEVIGQLRDEMSNTLERDNELLAERAQLMDQLDTLSTTLAINSGEQQQSIENFITGSSKTLTEIGEQFGTHLASESEKMSVMADSFTSSGIELASWAEAFQSAVHHFSESNVQLMESLSRIEQSLSASNERSDEQLAYYVAQAREIIDHNVLSHQKIISALNAQKPTQLAVSGVAK